jgi:hypothetical protein|nr:MAG TPA: hypothetical protein [Caudoviricetes sp.]
MDPIIKESIIILALQNLVFDYSESLESLGNEFSQEEKDFALNVITHAQEILEEYENKPIFQSHIQKPQWKKPSEKS